MRPLASLLLLALLPFGARAAVLAEDIKSIPLISTGSYDPTTEQGRGLKEFFTGIGVGIAGPSQDLGKLLRDKLENPALRTYFPDATERARIAQLLSNDAKTRFLSHGYTNQTVLAAMKYLTDRLIGTVVVRVLQKEGVKDVNRAGAWADKIKVPYDKCMAAARTYSEGTKCGAPLEADVIKNVGLALTYEMTRDAFGTGKTTGYQACLKPTQPGADSRVRDCAIQGVRTAASDFGRTKVFDTAQKMKLSPAIANSIVAKVMPGFDKCLKAAKDRDGFAKCGDGLIGSAGAEIASNGIMNDPRVITFFPASTDREKIAASGRDAFAQCMADNARDNLRDSNKTLRTDNCESFVTLETSKAVAFEVFRATLDKNLTGATPADKAALLRKAGDTLAKCWDSKKPESDNATCLRGVAKQLALDVAEARLKKELPPDVPADASAKLLADFADCLEKKLPANLLKGDGAEAAANACSAGTFRNAALSVAEAKVRAALKGKLPDGDAVERIVSTLVKVDFAACLGDAPSAATLASCSLKLQKNVALQAALTILPARVDDFFKEGGGIEAYGLTGQDRQQLLDGVISVHKQCLKTQVTTGDGDAGVAQIESCFKTTIRDLALKLGALEFKKAAKANGVDIAAPAYTQISKDFLDGFGACIDKKKDGKFSLEDYLAGLAVCQAEITNSTTAQVAKNELSSTIKQILGDAGSELQTKLLNEFDDCMSKAKDLKAGQECLATLKAHATLELARQGVKKTALEELSVTEVPPEITALDATLDSCVDEKKKTSNDCAVDYAKEAAGLIGHLKLDGTLRPFYGDAGMAKLAPDLKKLEEPFRACVAAVPPPLNKQMLDAFAACGVQLTSDAMMFLAEHPDGPADTPVATVPAVVAKPKAKPPSADELSEMIARTFLCLSGGLEPGSEQALKNLEPGSVEDTLLKLIGSFVSYDVDNADGRYEEALAKLGDELKAAGPEAARKKLLDVLSEKGMTDQLLKAMVKSELDKSLSSTPELAAKVSNKAVLDKAFSDEVLAKLRPAFSAGVLQPVLIDGKSLSSTLVLRSFREVRNQAVDALLASPDSGLDDDTRAAARTALGRP